MHKIEHISQEEITPLGQTAQTLLLYHTAGDEVLENVSQSELLDYIERCEMHLEAYSFLKEIFQKTIESVEEQILLARKELEKMEQYRIHAEIFFKDMNR